MIIQMKTILIPLFLISLLLFTSFGLVAMTHMGHIKCPFESVRITDCFQAQSPIDFTTSHLIAVARFFSVIPAGGFTGIISLALLFALALFVVFNRDFGLFKSDPLLRENFSREIFVPLNASLLSRWLSLHENSPSTIFGR